MCIVDVVANVGVIVFVAVFTEIVMVIAAVVVVIGVAHMLDIVMVVEISVLCDACDCYC